MADIYGARPGPVKQFDLADADDVLDFDTKLASLEVMWDTLVPRFNDWFAKMRADKFQSNLVLNARKSLNITGREDQLKVLGLWYHRNRNKEYVSRAEKLKLKARETQLVVAEKKGVKLQTPCHHLLRSLMPFSSGSEAARNVHILPEICIICKKKDVYQMNKRSGKRTLAKLVLAETVDGGLLRKTAEAKKDENILHLIRDTHCVAIEVRALTRFEKAHAQDPLYAKSLSLQSPLIHGWLLLDDDSLGVPLIRYDTINANAKIGALKI
eukprot:gene5746-11007_t